MAKLSPVREAMPVLKGLKLLHRGKVRDIYELQYGLLLIVATDAISIFDFLLNAVVPDKGMILTIMSHYFFRYLESLGFRTHLVAAGSAIDTWIPEHLRDDPHMQARAMIVRRLKMYPVEFVLRSHFVKASSAFRDYDPEHGGTICGHALPPGLQDGDKFPAILDTPTTKVAEGHDESVDYREARYRYPRLSQTSMEAYMTVSELLETRGTILADSKMEGGLCEWNGIECIGDEMFTPDCSRFWDIQQWVEAQAQPIHTAPSPYDKQFVRAEGKRLGVHKLDPLNPDHVDTVHRMQIADGILQKTSALYHEIAQRVMQEEPLHYLEHQLGVEGYV